MKVFITGVTSGLGKALCEEFLGRGGSVWGVGLKDIVEDRENFYYSRCDVSDEESVKRVYAQMRDKGFLPDAVVLNAAIMKDDLNPSFSYSVFKEIFKVNLFGAMNWVDAFLPEFLKNKKGIFAAISSLSAQRALVVKRIGYPSSKSALSMSFESFRIQLAGSGVRFITFHIGPMGEKNTLLPVSHKKAAKRIADNIKFKKSGDVVNFSFAGTALTKMSRLLPDNIASKIFFKIKKAVSR